MECARVFQFWASGSLVRFVTQKCGTYVCVRLIGATELACPEKGKKHMLVQPLDLQRDPQKTIRSRLGLVLLVSARVC